MGDTKLTKYSAVQIQRFRRSAGQFAAKTGQLRVNRHQSLKNTGHSAATAPLPYTARANPKLPMPLPEAAKSRLALHRLDAGTGLRADVPDPLLRLLAQPAGEAEPFLHVFAAGRDVSGSAVSVPGGDFVCAGHGETLAEGCSGGGDRADDYLAWRARFSSTDCCFGCRNM